MTTYWVRWKVDGTLWKEAFRTVAQADSFRSALLTAARKGEAFSCLSTWLNGGVYPTQVAEWAGHSVDVLLRIYAKCVVGQDELAKRRISEALQQD